MSDTESFILNRNGSTAYWHYNATLLYDDPPLSSYDYSSNYFSRTPFCDIKYPDIFYDCQRTDCTTYRILNSEFCALHFYCPSELYSGNIR